MALMYVPEAETRQLEYDSIDGLLALRDSLDFGNYRAEILEGRLVVSPVPVFWHERTCQWLQEALQVACNVNGWFAARRVEIELSPTMDRIEPDLTILTNPDQLPDLENVTPVSHVLLVAEVTSPSSIRADRMVKPHACAAAGIPFYLLVDRFTDKLTVVLHAAPGNDGYAETHSVPVGGKLDLPLPFGLTLDTGTLPLPRLSKWRDISAG